MTATSSTQILIVGAGPTGLALASHCLQLGLRVRIIDKQAGPSTTSKAVGLQYRVSEVLACMGVVDRFLERGSTPTLVNLYSGGRRRAQLDFLGARHASGQDAFAPRAIMLPQSDTESLLGDLLRERGGRVEWNTEFVGFVQDQQRVLTCVRQGNQQERISADYLVSCEGAHSVIRGQAGLSFTGKTYPLAFFMADVEVADLEHGSTHVWLHEDGAFAALPFARPGFWRLMVEVTRQPHLHGNVTLEAIRELMAHRVGIQAQIDNPTWISEFRIHCRLVDHYRQGRVFLAGDAAHIHSPTGGQGIVTGLQDATNLAWKLARVLRGAPEALLDTYEEERQPKAREVLRETDRATNLMTAPTRRLRFIRDRLFLPIIGLRWVQRKLFSRFAQLHVHYRDSRLSRHEDGNWLNRSHLRAGDRAPDVMFRLASSGERRALFELLRPMRPVVLLGTDGSAGSASRCETVMGALGQLDMDAYLITPPDDRRQHRDQRYLVDEHGDWRRIYGLEGEYLCLIRPDDHVGLVQRPLHLRKLQDYLRDLCPADAVEGAFQISSEIGVGSSSTGTGLPVGSIRCRPRSTPSTL